MVQFLYPVLREPDILRKYPTEIVDMTKIGNSVKRITAEVIIPGVGFASVSLKFNGNRFTMDIAVNRSGVKKLVEERIHELVSRYKSPDYILTELSVRLDEEKLCTSGSCPDIMSDRWLNIVYPDSSSCHLETFA